jgi:competence protein ComEC
VVAALLLWADAMSRWLWPPDPVARRAVGAGELAGRWLLAAVSAAVVAWAVSLPLVAYRFALVSPLAALLSVLALVPLTAVLAGGYVKLAVGLGMPGVGGLLGGPLAWLTDTLIGLVAHASRWPGVAWELARPVSGWWTLGALAVVVALLGGRFAGRAWRGALAVAVVTGWLVVGQLWPMQDARVGPGTVAGGSALRVDMFNVGDGSSYLLRSGGQAMLFDCGSRSYPAVGLQSLVPALERLGVGRLDALVISHADLDHMVAALDIADAVRVDRVVVAPDVPRAAGWSVVEAQRAGGAVARPPAERSGEAGSAAAAALLEGLLERGHEVQVVQRGWSMMLGGARVRALWPRAGWVPRRNNDASLVLQVTPGGALTGGPLPGGLLLTGDVGEAAIGPLVAMEGPGGLSASVMELPHHGSWAGGSSLALVDAAGPAWVLQSAGDRALDVDRWAVPLAERGVRRRVTARDGWSTLWVEADGSVRVGP